GSVGVRVPPATIALQRKQVVDNRAWLPASEFEDCVAAVNLLPGPASTQLAIYCAWRLRGAAGALVGGAGFILPGLAVILALSALSLAGHPPGYVAGAAHGAGAAVPAVAVAAALGLIPASGRRPGRGRAPRAGLGSDQGRRPVVRRRIRDHPADAARRGHHLPLDERRPVPHRGGARPGHAGPGGADRGGGRVRRRRGGRRAA